MKSSESRYKARESETEQEGAKESETERKRKRQRARRRRVPWFGEQQRESQGETERASEFAKNFVGGQGACSGGLFRDLYLGEK